MSDAPIFRSLMNWVDAYGRSGVPDQRAVEDFLLCESAEAIRSLQAELIAITRGRYVAESLATLLGANRREKHGSWEAWAKLMLQWLSAVRP